MIRIILFDLGGVIFTDFFSGGEADLAKILDLPSKTIFNTYVKTDVPEYCKDELSDFDRWKAFTKELSLPDSIIQTCIDEYYRSYKLFPESFSFIKNLKHVGKYKLDILSDQPLGVAKYLRSQYKQVFDCFEKDLTIISAEVKLSKKDPDFQIYNLVIKRANVLPGEILFVDNSLHNIEMAHQAGMKTLFFDIKKLEIPSILHKLRLMLSS